MALFFRYAYDAYALSEPSADTTSTARRQIINFTARRNDSESQA